MSLTLYIANKNYSSWSLRPWLALARTGAAFDEVLIPLGQPDSAERIRAVSPSGRVPALREGELVIWESLAICEYLAERFPAARLWPEEPAARARARTVSSEMHAGFAALRQAMPMNIRRAPSPVPHDEAVRTDIARLVSLWETCREQYGTGGPFLFGRFSIADAMFAPVVSRFRTYAVPLSGVAAAWADAVWNDEAMQAWVAAARSETTSIAKYESR